jgi:hypothetical protein
MTQDDFQRALVSPEARAKAIQQLRGEPGAQARIQRQALVARQLEEDAVNSLPIVNGDHMRAMGQALADWR